MTRDEMAEWQAILNSNGWGAIGWPEEHGGTGWSDPQKAIFQAEAARVNAPGQSPFGVTMVGPVICAFGTDEREKILNSRAFAAYFQADGLSLLVSGILSKRPSICP